MGKINFRFGLRWEGLQGKIHEMADSIRSVILGNGGILQESGKSALLLPPQKFFHLFLKPGRISFLLLKFWSALMYFGTGNPNFSIRIFNIENAN